MWISPTASSSPSPLDEKNTKTNEVRKTLEVKAGDSERLNSESKNPANRDISNFCLQYGRVSESKNKVESAKARDSKKLESTIDSDFEKQASRDTSAFSKPLYDKNLDSKKLAESIRALDSKKLDLESKHHAKIGEANLRDKSVLVVGAHSSVGRIVSFLCEEAGALVFRVSSTQVGHNLAESHNEHLESKSRAKPTNALDSQTLESSAHHLSYTELSALRGAKRVVLCRV